MIQQVLKQNMIYQKIEKKFNQMHLKIKKLK